MEGLDMAHSDLLRRLFAAYARGDEPAFRAAAGQIVEDERRKKHVVLARELEEALNVDQRPGAVAALTLRPVPKGRDDRPLLRLSKPDHCFADLVLAEATTSILTEVVRENNARSVLSGHGLRPRHRLLFVGPSGTGKSASAHAVAADVGLPVATVSLPAITSSFLGETARNIEAVVRFAEATPCMLLLDEFDSLAAERGDSADHGELKRVVATVLQLLEDVRGDSVYVATSNHPSLLDSAVWRRFDEVVQFALPTEADVEALLRLRLRAVRHRIDRRHAAFRLAGATQAEVEMVCADAMRRLILDGGTHLTDADLAAAVDRHEERRRASTGRRCLS
jgi:SpoVK/Ycf46/Vps4 family AAA+-type ATPase